MKQNEVPAIFVNHMSVTSYRDNSVTISFGTSLDGNDETATYHSAIHLPFQVLKNLQGMLEKISSMMMAGETRENAN
jgi:hypothetical protein